MKNIFKNVAIATIAGGVFLATTLAQSANAQAADGCFAVGEKYASANRVSLIAAEEATKDGQAVCKVVVLKEASGGNRPKREVVYLSRE